MNKFISLSSILYSIRVLTLYNRPRRELNRFEGKYKISIFSCLLLFIQRYRNYNVQLSHYSDHSYIRFTQITCNLLLRVQGDSNIELIAIPAHGKTRIRAFTFF